MTVTLALLLALGASAANDVDPVDVGQSVLSRGGYPWYDRWNDTNRLVLPEKSSSRAPAQDWELPGFDLVARLLMYFLIAVVVASLLFFLITILRQPGEPKEKGTKRTGGTIDRIEALPTRVRDVEDFLEEAERCVARGDYAEAMIYYYSHQLITLDHFGLIRLLKGKTNGQYLRELRRERRQLSDQLTLSVRLFEDVFFGELPLDEGAFLTIWNRRQAFLDEVEGPA